MPDDVSARAMKALQILRLRIRWKRSRGGKLHDATAGQVTDPVCGMKIRPQDAAGSSEFNGHTIYFCSKGCKQAFDANPAKYAGQSSGARGG